MCGYRIAEGVLLTIECFSRCVHQIFRFVFFIFRNVYSRKHISKNPDDIFSDFWDFTWYATCIILYQNQSQIDFIICILVTLYHHYVYFSPFSRVEMGLYDQPAVIDYILEKTMNTKLYYVGYSQGTTSIMVLLSEKPEYNDKIHIASLMAPVAFTNHEDFLYQILARTLPLFVVNQNQSRFIFCTFFS